MPLPLNLLMKKTLCMTKRRVIIRGFEFKRLKNIQSFYRQSFSLVPVLHTDEKLFDDTDRRTLLLVAVVDNFEYRCSLEE